MDPIWNCVLQVCCDPLSDNRRKAMIKLLVNAGCEQAEAEHVAPYVLKAIQPLIEALEPFIDFIKGLARGEDFKE